MIVQFHGITFDLAAGWEDITDDVPGAWPPTLAKASGVGALQFSIAKYRSGEKPNAGFDVLRSFMIEFCHNNLIDTNHISEEKFASTISVGVLYRKADETLSAWYLSNGNDFAFVTYVGLGEESEIMNEELDEVRAVVSSISF